MCPRDTVSSVPAAASRCRCNHVYEKKNTMYFVLPQILNYILLTNNATQFQPQYSSGASPIHCNVETLRAKIRQVSRVGGSEQLQPNQDPSTIILFIIGRNAHNMQWCHYALCSKVRQTPNHERLSFLNCGNDAHDDLDHYSYKFSVGSQRGANSVLMTKYE